MQFQAHARLTSSGYKLIFAHFFPHTYLLTVLRQKILDSADMKCSKIRSAQEMPYHSRTLMMMMVMKGQSVKKRRFWGHTTIYHNRGAQVFALLLQAGCIYQLPAFSLIVTSTTDVWLLGGGGRFFLGAIKHAE